MELSWDCLFVLFWAQIFANTTCSKLIVLCFFRRCVINVLIFHSSLRSERGLRRKSSWEKGLCFPRMGFSKCLYPCDHGDIPKWLISTMPSPEPSPQPPLNSLWTLMNSASKPSGNRLPFVFKASRKKHNQGWHAELSAELPWWHGHTQKSCLCLKCSSVEWTSKSTAPCAPLLHNPSRTVRLKTNA